MTTVRQSKQSEDVFIIEDVRTTFCAVLKPQKAKDSQEADKYKLTILIPKNTNLKVLQDHMSKKIEERWGNNIPHNLRNGFNDGDDQKQKQNQDDNLRGCWYVHLKNNADFGQPPMVFDEMGNQLAPEMPDNKNVIYPGCYVNVGVSIYTYPSASKSDSVSGRGVALNIISVQKVRDGDRIISKSSGGFNVNREEFASEFVQTKSAYDTNDIEM